MADDLLVHGTMESAEVLDDFPQIILCECGNELHISGGVIVNAGFKVIVDGAKTTPCSKCGKEIPI